MDPKYVVFRDEVCQRADRGVYHGVDHGVDQDVDQDVDQEVDRQEDRQEDRQVDPKGDVCHKVGACHRDHNDGGPKDDNFPGCSSRHPPRRSQELLLLSCRILS